MAQVHRAGNGTQTVLDSQTQKRGSKEREVITMIGEKWLVSWSSIGDANMYMRSLCVMPLYLCCRLSIYTDLFRGNNLQWRHTPKKALNGTSKKWSLDGPIVPSKTMKIKEQGIDRTWNQIAGLACYRTATNVSLFVSRSGWLMGRCKIGTILDILFMGLLVQMVGGYDVSTGTGLECVLAWSLMCADG